MSFKSRMVQMPMPFMPVMSAATLSECGSYRYTLSRSLDHQAVNDEYVEWEGKATDVPRLRCLFVMLNPSTADAYQNDPTIEKCIKLARNWGHHVLDVGNLYAFRSKDPKDLRGASRMHGVDVIGQVNDAYLKDLAWRAHTIVLAWGANSPIPERAEWALGVLREGSPGERLFYCIKQNKDGSPVHPLYQRDDSQLVPYVRKVT